MYFLNSVFSDTFTNSSLQCSHVSLWMSSHPLLSHRGQLDQILCAGIVHNASLWSIWEHMEEPLDNGALVMLASTKRPRQAQTGGRQPCWCVCVCVCVCVWQRERKERRVFLCLLWFWDCPCMWQSRQKHTLFLYIKLLLRITWLTFLHKWVQLYT